MDIFKLLFRKEKKINRTSIETLRKQNDPISKRKLKEKLTKKAASK